VGGGNGGDAGLELLEAAPRGEERAEIRIGVVGGLDRLIGAADAAGAMEAGRIEAHAAHRLRRLAVAGHGRRLGAVGEIGLHVFRLFEGLGHGLHRGAVGGRHVARHQVGELLRIRLAGHHGGEEGLAALEPGGALLDGAAHLGDLGLHLRDLLFHAGHVAVHGGDRLEGGEGRPAQQHKSGQGGRFLDAGTDGEAAQALAVVQENVARPEERTELRDKAGVGNHTVRHFYPRSARRPHGHSWRPH